MALKSYESKLGNSVSRFTEKKVTEPEEMPAEETIKETVAAAPVDEVPEKVVVKEEKPAEKMSIKMKKKQANDEGQKRITIVLDNDIYNQLRCAAFSNETSKAGYIVSLLTKDLEKNKAKYAEIAKALEK